MKLNQTPKTNTNSSSKTECLVVSIIRNPTRAFTYSVWYADKFLGELIEDDIQRLLGDETKKFYQDNQTNFLVAKNKIKTIINKTKYF